MRRGTTGSVSINDILFGVGVESAQSVGNMEVIPLIKMEERLSMFLDALFMEWTLEGLKLFFFVYRRIFRMLQTSCPS